MILEMSKTERNLLSSLKVGISQMLIFKVGLYPTSVSFRLKNNGVVTIGVKEEYLAPRFEVFPILVSEKVYRCEPETVIDLGKGIGAINVSILRKSEWDTPASDDVKSMAIGNTSNATSQCEGKLADVPSSAINQVTLDAGIEITGVTDRPILIATSMFPYALYVSDCKFSEPIDANIYDRVNII